MKVSHYMSGPEWEGESHKPKRKPRGKSGIHIKPENKGKFTARAKAHGNTVQEQARKDLANPNVSGRVKKEANFARNARKWNHG